MGSSSISNQCARETQVINGLLSNIGIDVAKKCGLETDAFLKNAAILHDNIFFHKGIYGTLCDQLGVSRSVIREVLRHLETEGLTETAPKQGPIVALIDWHQARQIYDVRIALETTAVADCARNATPATKEKLKTVLKDLDRNSRKNDPLTILDATTQSYETIFLSGGHENCMGYRQALEQPDFPSACDDAWHDKPHRIGPARERSSMRSNETILTPPVAPIFPKQQK